MWYAQHEDADRDSASITKLNLAVQVPSTMQTHALCVQVGFRLRFSASNTECGAVGSVLFLLFHSGHSSWQAPSERVLDTTKV